MKEYSTRFNHIIRYAPEIANTEKIWMEKFVYRLNPNIAQDVITRQ